MAGMLNFECAPDMFDLSALVDSVDMREEPPGWIDTIGMLTGFFSFLFVCS